MVISMTSERLGTIHSVWLAGFPSRQDKTLVSGDRYARLAGEAVRVDPFVDL